MLAYVGLGSQWVWLCSWPVLLLLTGCVTRGEVEELQKNQELILAKLDKLDKSIVAARPAVAALPSPAMLGPDLSKIYAFPLGDSPSHGASNAWVTLVEVSDFQCPFCGRANLTLKEIDQAYGENVRLIFKHNPLPFHARALPAAMATLCAQQQHKFWQLHDLIFANQRLLEDHQLEGYAKAAGLDLKKYHSCLQDKESLQAKINKDHEEAEHFGVRGTPAFFINGRFLSGAQPLAAFKVLIDEELAKAKASGIDQNVYYQQAVLEKGQKNL